jgi:glycosyltransferase involved in cell wall biosynthesis
MQSWTIGLLCYNEEESIEKVLDTCFDVLSKMTNDFEVLVINDGSKDNSLSIITKYKAEKRNDLIIINHEKNKGIGEALFSGYKNARKENVLITCGDGQFDLNELLPFKEIEDKTVLALYRKENTSYSLHRNILSYFNKLFNKTFLGLTLKDVNWVKIYKLNELKKFDLKIRSSLIESEICSKLHFNGNRFIEIESRYLDRIGGESKGASFKIVKQALFDMLSLVIEITKFRIKK